MDRPRRIGQEAPIAGVLEKRAVETRRVRIALIDTSFHSVHDDAPGTIAKKRQGVFETIDDGGQILLENGDHAAEPAVAKRHDKAVHHPRAAATEFLQQAGPGEINFCYFAG